MEEPWKREHRKNGLKKGKTLSMKEGGRRRERRQDEEGVKGGEAHLSRLDEYAAVVLALEVLDAVDDAVVLSTRLVQSDADPLA